MRFNNLKYIRLHSTLDVGYTEPSGCCSCTVIGGLISQENLIDFSSRVAEVGRKAGLWSSWGLERDKLKDEEKYTRATPTEWLTVKELI